MATLGNERYLRHILLLGEGGLLVLRNIVIREAARRGQTLEHIISSNRVVFQTILREQYRTLFPGNSSVNADVHSWDISLLRLVVKRLFWSSLSSQERDKINILQTYRDDVQAHPTEISMGANDYATIVADVTTALRQLAAGINQQTIDEVESIICRSGSDNIDIHSTLRHIQGLNEFKIDLLNLLETKLETVYSRISNVDEKLNDIREKILEPTELHVNDRQNIEDIQTVQGHLHEDVLDVKEMTNETVVTVYETNAAVSEIKAQVNAIESHQDTRHGQLTSQLQGLHVAAQSTSQDISKIKELAAIPKVLCDEDRNILKSVEEKVSNPREMAMAERDRLINIEEMLRDLISKGANSRHTFQQDLDTTLRVRSNTRQNAIEAENMIITIISDILLEIRPLLMRDRDRIETIRRSAAEILAGHEGSSYELARALLELIKDIVVHGDVLSARKGCIKLTIRFWSYEGILNFIQYLGSKKFQQCLNEVGKALKLQIGQTASLSACIAQDSLCELHHHLDKVQEIGSRRILLPIQCKGIEDLDHIWTLLQRGGAEKHLERISGILTKLVGGKTTVTSSVDLKQFEKALLHLDTEHQSFASESKGSQFTETQTVKHTDEVEAEWVIIPESYEEHLHCSADVGKPVTEISERKRPKSNEQSSTGLQEDVLAREYKFTVKSSQKYSVRGKEDTFDPWISGCCILPKSEILLADYRKHKRVMKLDSFYNLVSQCDLPATPRAVCYIDNGRAVVSLDNKCILFLLVSDNLMLIDRQLNLEHYCSGLAYHGSTLYVTGGNTVYTYNTDGKRIRVFYISESDWFWRIAVSGDGEKIYIATTERGLLTTDKYGNHLSTLKPGASWWATDVCVAGDGSVLVSDWDSQCVLQADYKGERVLGCVVDRSNGVNKPRALCFDRLNSKLIVGYEDQKHISVFELQ